LQTAVSQTPANIENIQPKNWRFELEQIWEQVSQIGATKEYFMPHLYPVECVALRVFRKIGFINRFLK
jgi:hypothetical protein